MLQLFKVGWIFIIHQLEKNGFENDSILFPCDVIAVVWTLLLSYNYNDYYNFIGIVIALGINRSRRIYLFFENFTFWGGYSIPWPDVSVFMIVCLSFFWPTVEQSCLQWKHIEWSQIMLCIQWQQKRMSHSGWWLVLCSMSGESEAQQFRFISNTLHWCVGCREMDSVFWGVSSPQLCVGFSP